MGSDSSVSCGKVKYNNNSFTIILLLHIMIHGAAFTLKAFLYVSSSFLVDYRGETAPNSNQHELASSFHII